MFFNVFYLQINVFNIYADTLPHRCDGKLQTSKSISPAGTKAFYRVSLRIFLAIEKLLAWVR